MGAQKEFEMADLKDVWRGKYVKDMQSELGSKI